MTIHEFQQLIRDKYYATDSARGAPGTYLWFVEEVGELAHAIANRERGKLDTRVDETCLKCGGTRWRLTDHNTRTIREFTDWSQDQLPKVRV